LWKILRGPAQVGEEIALAGAQGRRASPWFPGVALAGGARGGILGQPLGPAESAKSRKQVCIDLCSRGGDHRVFLGNNAAELGKTPTNVGRTTYQISPPLSAGDALGALGAACSPHLARTRAAIGRLALRFFTPQRGRPPRGSGFGCDLDRSL